MKLRLDIRLTQKLIMTPQLQQAIKLLQLSRLELQQTLTQHLTENPLLEEVQTETEEAEIETPDEWSSSNGTEEQGVPAEGASAEGPERQDEETSGSWEEYFDGPRGSDAESLSTAQDEFPSYEQTLAKPTSLEDHLLWQLGLLSLTDAQKAIGRIIIGNLDEDGYLRMPIEEVAADAGASREEVEAVLSQIQTFDPAGVGARDLCECLLIQLRHPDRAAVGATRLGHSDGKVSLAEAIVANHLADLEKKQYARIAKVLGAKVEDVVQAVRVIEEIEPKPGRPYFASNNYVIIPDVFVVKNEGEWVVLLNEDGLPRLRISPFYRQMMANQKGSADQTRAYLEEKFRGAQWIIRSIEQRNKTILKVVKSIVKFQEAFFEQGIAHLKPLVLKQVAEDVGMHESTISRVTANKYLYCPQGMLELKFFFNTGIQCSAANGEMLSSLTVREMVRKMVAEENAQHPLKDQEIAARLRQHHITIARRTVAKYRSEENIPPASQRKRFL